MQKERFIDAAEREGWKVSETDSEFELSKFSPLGEDFNFCVERRNAAANVLDYYEDFDPEEHAAMWINAKTQKGNPSQVPGTLKDICQDADDIDEMLGDLARAVQAAMSVTVKISDIKYETDGEVVDDLPESIGAVVNLELEDIDDEDAMSEYLGSYISDVTGWLHNGFSWKIVG